MNRYVADTHALFWYLINSTELGSKARLAFDEADNGQAFIYVPAIVIAELFYLNEKKGKPLDFAAKYATLVKSNSLSYCRSIPTTSSISTLAQRSKKCTTGLSSALLVA